MWIGMGKIAAVRRDIAYPHVGMGSQRLGDHGRRGDWRKEENMDGATQLLETDRRFLVHPLHHPLAGKIQGILLSRPPAAG
jgi:hypothetical protein